MSTEIHALAGAFALDAVNDIERAEFSRHVADCETCALEVAELRATTARLADSTWSAAPPRLRDNVLRQVSHTRQARPGRPGGGRVNPAEETRRPRHWRRWAAAGVAAVVFALSAAGATYVLQERRIGDQQQQADRLRGQMSQMQAVMVADDSKGTKVPVQGGGQIAVVYSDSENMGVVMLAGLDALDSAKAYQLWVTPDGKKFTPAGVLRAGAHEGVRLVHGVRDAEAVAINVEPAGGSQEPTSDALAKVPLR